MPESSTEDPFAELFGQLPDPGSRRMRTSVDDDARGSGPGVGSPPATAGVNTGGVPLSRREAREAAARQSPAESASPASTAEPAPETSPAREPAPAPVRSESLPTTQALDVTADEEPWIFANAGTAPAMPYSRSGSASGLRPEPAPQGSEPSPQRSDAAAASLESLFSGEAHSDDLGTPPPPRNKRRRRIGGWIALGVVLVILGGIAGGGLWVWSTYEPQIRKVMGWEPPKDYAEGLANGEAVITIASGDTGQPISAALYKAGVTKTPQAFYDYLIDSGQNPTFVPGVFKLQKQMTSAAALKAILDPANKMENTAQLREGLTVKASLPILASATGLPVKDFEAAVAKPSDYGVAAKSLEGWLFPATYTFDPGVTAPQVIKTLVDRTVKSLDTAGVPVADRQRILTVASIVQKEAGYEQDFYKVSRVIENRLDPSNNETYGLLQMDSTAKYGVGEEASGSLDVSKNAQTDDNPWNTYLHPGLPIGPISNPGDLAIDAAMHPADGPWLYFVTVDPSTGETVFTQTLSEHQKYVKQWQQWCSAHPDYPC